MQKLLVYINSLWPDVIGRGLEICEFDTFYNHRERRTESKTDSYSKDLLFLASFAFCVSVITFEPVMI